jgi:3-hydroxybutyryl-CoA dehydrogenase
VEIVLGKYTSEETFQCTFQILKKIGKQPVKVLKEIPGFLVNRIQTAMFREVLSLLEQKIASPEDLDRAVRDSFGLRLGVIGVLETMDMAGLDLMYKGTRHLYKFIDNSVEPQRVLKEKVDKGDLGVKTGKGFFSYESGSASTESESKVKKRDKKLLEILKVLAS